MSYVLGIDQGGSHTRAVVMDIEGNILGYHKTGGCYFPVAGIERAINSISAAAGNALRDAEITMSDIGMIVAGVTGIDWAGDDVVVSNALKKRFGDKQIIACNDCEIAYYSGSLKAVGAVICAGTGANAALFALGGKKFVLSDYLKSSLQGGSAIARRAIEAVFESDLGVLPETKLTELFLSFSNSGGVHDLLRQYMTSEGFAAKIISLAPRIIEIADHGDAVAQGLLTTFTDELCACFIAAMKKMDMLELDCDIVLAGSVLMGRINGLTTMITKRLSQLAKNATIVNAGFEPVVGAGILGILEKTGEFNERMVQNMTVSAKKAGLSREGLSWQVSI